MDEQQRNLMIAIALMMAVLFGFQWLNAPRQPRLAQEIARQQQAGAPTDTTAPSAATRSDPADQPVKAEPPVASATPQAAIPPTSAMPQPAAMAASVELKTPTSKIIATADGFLKQVQLLDFRSGLDAGSAPINWIDLESRDGHPTGAIQFAAIQGREVVRPSTVEQLGGAIRWTFAGAVSGTIELHPTDANTYQWLAEARFDPTARPDGWLVRMARRFDGSNTATGLATAGIPYWRAGEITVIDPHEVKPEDGPAEHKLGENLEWIGTESKYFISIMLLEQLVARRTMVYLNPATSGTVGSVDTIAALDAGGAAQLGLFLGPKDLNILSRVGHHLDKTIDLGWFSIIARPLLRLLHLFHHWIPNWGVGIILLTVLIKLILYPIQRRGTQSMKKMQDLKPRMDEVKTKFDARIAKARNAEEKLEIRRQMQLQMAEVYKQAGVSPLGGCLPLFLQLPVFVALYNVLYQAIELRHAPFFLWITDLSQPDVMYMLPVFGGFALRLLPLLVGATMFWQQKVMPAAGDPQQQAIMQWMPLLFTFMFYGMPSGLMIYWMTQNILTIAQTLWDNRQKSSASA